MLSKYKNLTTMPSTSFCDFRIVAYKLYCNVVLNEVECKIVIPASALLSILNKEEILPLLPPNFNLTIALLQFSRNSDRAKLIKQTQHNIHQNFEVVFSSFQSTASLA